MSCQLFFPSRLYAFNILLDTSKRKHGHFHNANASNHFHFMSIQDDTCDRAMMPTSLRCSFSLDVSNTRQISLIFGSCGQRLHLLHRETSKWDNSCTTPSSITGSALTEYGKRHVSCVIGVGEVNAIGTLYSPLS